MRLHGVITQMITIITITIIITTIAHRTLNLT
jgi:hypothetical protein